MSAGTVTVTGIGLVTPAGIGVDANWAEIQAGRSTAALDPTLADSPVRISCRVPGFDADELLGARTALRLDPFVRFALVAAHEAIADSGLDPRTWDGARVGVVIGCANGGQATLEEQHQVLLNENPSWVSPLLLPMHLPNMVAGQLSMELGATGHSLVTATACASGATAIGVARDLLALDRCDVVVTGGTDALVTPLIVAGFARMGALSARHDDPAAASRPFDVDRDGFVTGEGAGILVLERGTDAAARGARSRGRIVGYGASSDAHHVTKPHPHGAGFEAATRAALADADAGPDAVGHVNAHGTATPLNDRIEGEMLARVLPHRPLVTSTKGVTGHLLGAAGAAEAIYTLLALEHGIIPPTANLGNQDPAIDVDVATEPVPTQTRLALSNAFGFGGHNAVLALASA